MKKIFKKILKIYLKYITKIVLLVHRPTIIVVAGSINKTFAKQAVKKFLEEENYSVRANPKNFNTEIGLPLAVLSLPSGYNSFKNWLPAITSAPMRLFQKNFPNFLVLSLGTSDPGDMKYLLSIVKPQIAIVTDITQRYLETFTSVNELFEEYTYLAKKIPKDGLLITNNDNHRLKSLGEFSKSKTITYSIKEKSDYRANELVKNSTGQEFQLNHQGKKVSFKINRFGDHHIYSAIIAFIIKNYVSKQTAKTK